MNLEKRKIWAFSLIGVLVGMFAMYVFSNYKIEKKTNETPYITTNNSETNKEDAAFSLNSDKNNSSEIDELTEEKLVINYVKKHKKLPNYYLTKSEARNQGWIASEGNLCEVLPGRAIGGDKFSNREKKLPKGEQYFEADVNYNCGRRNADRIVFTKNGDVWLTHNHYKTFEKY
ncbi:MAG: ribonuclease domain-containing protein [Cruoricaptor ignavus]|nr:ribonuclease domain-containing protein [Cruoricaptor ignavus]